MNASTVSHGTEPAPAISPGASTRPWRWPAYAVAVLFLVYAAGKAAFAAQSQLGLPTGPVVSAAAHDACERQPPEALPIALPPRWSIPFVRRKGALRGMPGSADLARMCGPSWWQAGLAFPGLAIARWPT